MGTFVGTTALRHPFGVKTRIPFLKCEILWLVNLTAPLTYPMTVSGWNPIPENEGYGDNNESIELTSNSNSEFANVIVLLEAYCSSAHSTAVGC